MADRRARDELAEFGFEDPSDPWLTELAEAVAPAEIGAIGPYEVEAEVARGGQGVVYRARQPGTGRDIALKRIVEGRLASSRARRRFRREVEAALRLRHPGIVTVLGFELVDGAPTIAMQWVDGVPIDEWARGVRGEDRLRRMLACFLRVCEAVEHAHRHGVLHLDLKPSNVLVDEEDRPVVLDFGLARLAQDDARATRSGTFLGTLAYASPEQLRGSRGSLDVRSDVYSLGVILYETCAGTPPFAFEEGIASALSRQEAGAYPRLAGLGIAPRLLARELDAIVARALAASRAERYPTVSALAEDVRRFLDGRPVQAHPPSLFYDLRKLAGRHRAVVGLALLVLALSTGFAIHATLQARKLERRTLLEQDARRAAGEAEAVAREEAATRGEILAFLLGDVFEQAVPGELGANAPVELLLDAASRSAGERFAGRPAVEAELRDTLGQVYQRLGRFDDSERELSRALELTAPGDPRGVARQVRLAHTLTGLERFGEALALLDAALPREAELDGTTRFELHAQRGLMLVLARRFEEAEDDYLRAFAIAQELGDPLMAASAKQGLGATSAHATRLDEARRHYTEALALARSAAGTSSTLTAEILGYLGDVDQVEGRLAEADAASREALEIYLASYGERHPLTIAALGDHGEVLSELGRLDEAEEMLARAVRLSEEVRPPGSAATGIHRLRLLRNRLRAGDVEGALAELELRLDELERALGPDAGWTCKALDSLVAAWTAAGHTEQAEAGLELLLRRGERGPPAWRARAMRRLCAEILHGQGRRAEAEALVLRSLADLDATPDVASFAAAERRRMAAYYAGRGDAALVAAIRADADEP